MKQQTLFENVKMMDFKCFNVQEYCCFHIWLILQTPFSGYF